jgi:hypothetical protein
MVFRLSPTTDTWKHLLQDGLKRMFVHCNTASQKQHVELAADRGEFWWFNIRFIAKIKELLKTSPNIFKKFFSPNPFVKNAVVLSSHRFSVVKNLSTCTGF